MFRDKIILLEVKYHNNNRLLSKTYKKQIQKKDNLVVGESVTIFILKFVLLMCKVMQIKK